MERPVATSGWQLGELLTPERRGDAFVLPPTGRKSGHVYGGQLLGLHPTWLRATSPLGDDLGLHAAVVAYLSDYGMGEAIAGSAVPVGGATVSHALWFHRVPRADDWIRLDVMPATAPGVSPGLAHGTFRGPDGAVAVSFAQEVLFR